MKTSDPTGESPPSPISVDRCINTLRGKIEADPEHPVFVKTIRDVGYRFELA